MIKKNNVIRNAENKEYNKIKVNNFTIYYGDLFPKCWYNDQNLFTVIMLDPVPVLFVGKPKMCK